MILHPSFLPPLARADAIIKTSVIRFTNGVYFVFLVLLFFSPFFPILEKLQTWDLQNHQNLLFPELVFTSPCP